MVRRLVLALLVSMSAASTAHAGLFSDPAAAGFSPRVPISSLGGVSRLFDPSRLQMSTSFIVGSGLGSTTSALNITSFRYQFRAPLSLSMSFGKAFGPGTSADRSSFFLEGLDMRYQPTRNSVVRIQYQNMRSPLQYGALGYGADRSYWND